ncbi:MAG: pantoate--beta-alanine ligase [Nitrospirae bacterium]|nr:pantoate--beta-alanine ligase [Nitrospirota bacterium]
MELIRIPRIMQDTCRKHLQKGRSIGFVPTMGALHDGHLSLIRRAKSENDIVVASIFVNPLQFGPSEDFASYPRVIDEDTIKLRELGIDVIFIPDNSLMYPPGFSTYIDAGPVSEKLCGQFRPGHFRGVATVVAKLLNLISPTRAYFGRKDFQQTVVIRRMTRDLDINTEIVVCPTIREEDGLAMSSRNRYLSAGERAAATVLFRAMSTVSDGLQAGGTSISELKKNLISEISKEGLITSIDYASIYNPETLEEIKESGQLKEVLVAVAVRMGKTRLIDNLIVNLT